MRIILFILLISSKLISQTKETELFFYDQCKDSIYQYEYLAENHDSNKERDTIRSKHYKVYFKIGDRYTIFIENKELRDFRSLLYYKIEQENINKIDTLIISDVHSTCENINGIFYPVTYKCNEKLNGEHISYYSDGKVKTITNYHNGNVLIFIKEYNEEGLIIKETNNPTKEKDSCNIFRFNYETIEYFYNNEKKIIKKIVTNTNQNQKILIYENGILKKI